MEINGTTALVTGSNRGLGRGLVDRNPADDLELRLAGRQRRRCGGIRARRHGRIGIGGNAAGLESEAGRGAEKPLIRLK